MDRVSKVLFVLCLILISVIHSVLSSFFLSCAARNEIQTEGGSPVKDVTCEQKPKERYVLVDLIATSLAEFYTSFFSDVQKANNGKWTNHLFYLNCDQVQ